MADERKVIKTIPSGVPQYYADVDVYDSTLAHMSDRGHAEELSRLEEIYDCIAAPHEIHTSTTNVRSVELFKDSLVSASGRPIKVVVKNVSEKPSIFVTSHICDSRIRGKLLWSANTGGQNEEE